MTTIPFISSSWKALLPLLFVILGLTLQAQGPDAFSTRLSQEKHFDYAFPTDHGLFKVRQQGKYTLVDSTGKVAPGWQWYDFIDNFWEGIARVRLQGRWGICNADGRLTLPLLHDTLSLGYQRQLVWFQNDGYWGMANGVTGEILLPAQLDVHYGPVNYPSQIWVVKKAGGMGLIDATGKWVAEPVYEWIGDNYGNKKSLLPFRRTDMFGFMDTTGQEIIAPILDYEMYRYNLSSVKGKTWVLKGGLWGLINVQGQWLIPPSYQMVGGRFISGAWVSPQPGMWGYVDTTGVYLLPPLPMDEAPWRAFSAGPTIIQQQKKYGVVGTEGQWLIPLRSEPIKYGPNNLLWLDNPGSVSVCTDDQGKVIIPESKIYSRLDHLYIFRKAAWSFVNPTGQWIKKPKLEVITQFRDGIAVAKSKGKWGLLVDNGKWLIPPKYDSAFSFYNYALLQDSSNQNNLVHYVAPVSMVDGEIIKNPKINQLFWLQKNNTWYLTDTSGQIFPKIAMDSVRQTQIICKDVFTLATPDKLWQLYRQDGTKISETSFEEVSWWASQDCSQFSVKLYGKWGSIDKNGKLEFPYLSDEPLYEGNLLDGRSIVECYGESFWVNQQWQLGVRYEKR